MSHAAMTIPGLDRVGGAEQQAILLAKGLRRRGWRVSMVALSGSGGTAAAELEDAGVRFLSLEMRKGLADPRGWIRFQRWLWREQPDVLHAHLPHAAWLSRWSRLAAPVPLVLDTLHSSSTGTVGRHFGYACSRWLADHVTAVSEAVAASHLAAGMVSEHNLSVIWNGIDVERWQPDARARSEAREALGIGDDFLWLAVGRLETVKDFPSLMLAMARTPARARLLVLGAGTRESELKNMAAGLDLGQRVRFAGFEPETHEVCLRSSCPEDLLYAVLVNLASVLRMAGLAEEARAYDEHARRGFIRIYGELHPFTLAATINYASDLAACDKLAKPSMSATRRSPNAVGHSATITRTR